MCTSTVPCYGIHVLCLVLVEYELRMKLLLFVLQKKSDSLLVQESDRSSLWVSFFRGPFLEAKFPVDVSGKVGKGTGAYHFTMKSVCDH